MSEKDWLVVAAVFLVLIGLGSLGMMGGWGYGWGGMMRGWALPSGTGPTAFWIFPLLCMALLVALGWLIFKAVRSHPHDGDVRSVLKMRLAKGEISQKEFSELSKVMVDGEQ